MTTPASGAAVPAPRARVPCEAGAGAATAATAALGALVRSLRTANGLSTRRLARRSAVARSTVQRLEGGQLRPRRSLLSAIALGIDPDHQKQILAELVAAAGGDEALAADGGWHRYRRRRLERGMLAGDVPLPTAIARALELHRQADELWLASVAIVDEPGALDDADALDEALRLHAESARLRELAGAPVIMYIAGKRISAGFGVP